MLQALLELSAAIIVPDSIVEATSYAKVRQNFLFDVRLNAVVSLPPFVFEPYTTEKTYILYFDKKMPQERGCLQAERVWHYVVDADGFQDGKKRYPINEDDFPAAKSGFLEAHEAGRCGLVEMADVNEANFFSMCSEYHLRRPVPTELPFDDFERLIQDLEGRI